MNRRPISERSRSQRVALIGALGGLLALAVTTIEPLRAQPPAGQGRNVPPVKQADGSGRAILDQYCVTCHNARLKTGGLSLDAVDLQDVDRHGEMLEKVVRKIRSGTMPPEGRPRPEKATLEVFVDALEKALDRRALQQPRPGEVASHRLNRTEYVNVIKDLLALEVNGEELLPSDMAGFGFDNNANVLTITPGLMARYMSAATKVSRVAVGAPENRSVSTVYKPAFRSRQTARMGEDMPFGTRGGVAVHHMFPLDGEYVFRLRLNRGDTDNVHDIDLRLDGGLLKRFTVGGQFSGPDPGVLIAIAEDDVEGKLVHDYKVNFDKDLEIRVAAKAGMHVVTVAFAESRPMPSQTGRLAIDSLEVSGPFNGSTPKDTASQRQIFVCRPTQGQEEAPCARKILSTLARRAYRRPVTASEVEALLRIYQEGRADRDFDTGIQRALEALLSSPMFLFRVERAPAGTANTAVYRLSDFELASRLSFFLWRSMPDDALLALAELGQLRDPRQLAMQAQRMLVDPKAKRFMNDFARQWLQIRNIFSHDPDVTRFPDFEPTLRDAMAQETELFFESQVRDDRPIPELLTANYSYLNERLARHYGIENVFGSHFRRVTVDDERRRGLLGHASILTVSSYADRTSVVLRGKWILETVLGAPPPPPPPNVPPLKDNDAQSAPLALRERMEAHRKSPVCASCHVRMDPLGFALEHFDAVGKWRETDAGAVINSTIMMDGQTIDSPAVFRAALVAQRGEFVRTVTEKLLTYALGRGVDYNDAPTVRQIGRNLAVNADRWSKLVESVVTSLPFRTGRADESATTTTNVVASK